MNKRIVSMIQKLAIQSERVTIGSLAEGFQVSQRTVRNDLNAINDLLREHELPILRLEKGGQVVREERFPELLGYLDENDFYDYKLSIEERKKIASVMLVSGSGFLTLSAMAEHMAVSRATIINDLDDIKAYIRKGGMEVVSHPNKGLRVEGRESDRRVFLMGLVSGHPDAAREDVVRKQIAVEEETREVLSKLLYEQEHVHESFLYDGSFQRILIYLEIMTNRIRKGARLEPRTKKQNSKTEMAKDILKYVEQYCYIKTTEDEAQFLSELLTFGQYIRQKDTDQDSVKSQMAARQFAEAVSAELEIDLNGDYDFFENLSRHLETSFPSARPDEEINPVVEALAKEHPRVMDAVERAGGVICRYAGRPLGRAELGYLAVHVCAALERRKNRETTFRVIVACHAGIGTSQLLMEKLKNHFHFHITDIVSSHEAGNLESGQADLVISTVPLRQCRIEHITVSPLLTDEDCIRIGRVLADLKEGIAAAETELADKKDSEKKNAVGLMEALAPILYDRVPEEAAELIQELGRAVSAYFQEPAEQEDGFSPLLYQFLPASHITLEVDCSSWQQAVRLSAGRLLELGYIEERYVDAMIRNIEENGPYIVLSKGFAFPHEGIGQGSLKTGMSLIRLSQPVEFGAEGLDPVEFVCTLSAADNRTHLKAFFHLVNLLKEDGFKEALRAAKTPKEAAESIRRYEQNADGE